MRVDGLVQFLQLLERRSMQVRAPGADFELVHKEIPESQANEVLLKKVYVK